MSSDPSASRAFARPIRRILALGLATMAAVAGIGAPNLVRTAAAAVPDVTFAVATGELSGEAVGATGVYTVAAVNGATKITADGVTWSDAPAAPQFVGGGRLVAYDPTTGVVTSHDLAGGPSYARAVPTSPAGYTPTRVLVRGAYTASGYPVSVVDLVTGATTDLGTDAYGSILMGDTAYVRMNTQYVTTGPQTVLTIRPLDGSAPPAPVTVDGYLARQQVAVAGGEVRYAKGDGTTVTLCRAPLATGLPVCEAVGASDRVTLELAATPEATVVASPLPTRVMWLAEGTSVKSVIDEPTLGMLGGLVTDTPRPLLTFGGVPYTVAADGSLKRAATYPRGPLVPEFVDITTGRVTYTDTRPGPAIANEAIWARSVTSTVGAETLLPKRASRLGARATNGTKFLSAGRSAFPVSTAISGIQTDVAIFDRVAAKASLATTDRPRISGPYLLRNDTMADHLGQPLGITAQAIFGSRYATMAPDGSSLVVRDAARPQDTGVTLPRPVGISSWEVNGLYGSWLVTSESTFSPNTPSQFRLVATNLDTGATLSRNSTDGSVLDTGAVGDGFVPALGGIWRFSDDTVVPDPTGKGLRFTTDRDRRIAFVDGTTVVVRTLDGVGTSPARVLGVVAGTTLDLAVPNALWVPEIDATKALAAGQLVFRDATGAVVRTLAVPATTDGSIRDTGWDGRNEEGAFVADGTYTWTYTAAGADGTGPAKAVDGSSPVTGPLTVSNAPVVNAPPPGTYQPQEPCRILDTRVPVGVPTRAKVPANGVLHLKVTGACGVPTTKVAAVALNVTVVNAEAGGYITVYPGNQTTTPNASNLNFVAGQIIPNMVIVKVAADGTINLKNASDKPVDLVADLAGWITAGTPQAPGAFTSLEPARLLDTRVPIGQPTIAAVPAKGEVSVQVTGVGGVPLDNVSAAVVNITAVQSEAGGYLTAFPSNATAPNASNVNFVAGQIIPNLAVVKVGPDGRIRIFNGAEGATHVLVDVFGFYRTGQPVDVGAFWSQAPLRILDTRTGVGTAQVGANGEVSLKVTGVGDVPATGVGAVVLNVTVTNTGERGYVTVYPNGTAAPYTSNLNFVRWESIPNLVIVKVGVDGKVNLKSTSDQPVDLIADLAGYYLG